MVNWLVAIDGSKHAALAMQMALQMMNKENDNLFLIGVVEELIGKFMYPTVSSNVVVESQHALESETRARLKAYGHSAKRLGVKNPHCLMATWSHVGEMICKAVEQKNIDYLVIGRRGLSNFERLVIGSTSKYVIENANCNVLVAKIDVNKKHETEEKEEEASTHFHSDLNKNITILAEEEERLRRITEEKPGGEEEQHARIAVKVAELIKDEQERNKKHQSILEAHKVNVETLKKKKKPIVLNLQLFLFLFPFFFFFLIQ